jgi:hypothetical protein
MAKRLGEPIHPRGGNPIRAEDVTQESPQFLQQSFAQLRDSLDELARRTENHANPVDEYQTSALGGGSSETQLSLLPTYEYMPEKILAIIINGPPNANVTLQLGDRNWPLVIPAAGILPIGPIAIIIGRSDPRILTAITPGQYSLELMGFADRRFKV